MKFTVHSPRCNFRDLNDSPRNVRVIKLLYNFSFLSFWNTKKAFSVQSSRTDNSDKFGPKFPRRLNFFFSCTSRCDLTCVIFFDEKSGVANESGPEQRAGEARKTMNKFHVNGLTAGCGARLASPARLGTLATPHLLSTCCRLP